MGVAFAVATGIRTFVVQPHRLPTGLMFSTINIGDHILANKFIRYFEEPKVGDIVVVDDPTGNVKTLVKRVIAAEGQTIDLVDGQVLVDGRTLDEPYTHDRPSEPQTAEMPHVVPESTAWLTGDNRTGSADSRSFGAVPVDTVRGVVFCRYWPLDRFGGL